MAVVERAHERRPCGALPGAKVRSIGARGTGGLFKNTRTGELSAS